MEKDKIFFGEGGITSTSANHCANVAKEMYQYLQNELFLMKLYTTEVSLIDSSEKKLLREGNKDIATIEEVIGSGDSDETPSATADAKVKSFSLDSGPVSTVSLYDCMDVTGKIVIDLSSVDDAQVKLLEKNYDVNEKTDSLDLKDNTVGDLKWHIKVPGTTSELKVSSASFDGDKLTLKVKGKLYVPSDPSGSRTIDVDKYDKVNVNMTFFDENSNEYLIEAK